MPIPRICSQRTGGRPGQRERGPGLLGLGERPSRLGGPGDLGTAAGLWSVVTGTVLGGPGLGSTPQPLLCVLPFAVSDLTWPSEAHLGVQSSVTACLALAHAYLTATTPPGLCGVNPAMSTKPREPGQAAPFPVSGHGREPRRRPSAHGSASEGLAFPQWPTMETARNLLDAGARHVGTRPLRLLLLFSPMLTVGQRSAWRSHVHSRRAGPTRQRARPELLLTRAARVPAAGGTAARARWQYGRLTGGSAQRDYARRVPVTPGSSGLSPLLSLKGTKVAMRKREAERDPKSVQPQALNCGAVLSFRG